MDQNYNKVKIKDYYRYNTALLSQAQIKYLLHNQPMAIGIDGSQSSFSSYKSGIYDDEAGCGTSVNHGVLMIGYGTEGGVDYWILKNSWGTGWGE
jgi:cathepsin L